MQISTSQHEKALSKIPVILTAKPVISQIGNDSLYTSAADTYQWFMNDEAIAGATKSGIKVNKNAMYKVSATIGTCTNYSDNKLVLITDIPQAPSKEIGLIIVSTDYVENIIKGNQFYIQFNNVSLKLTQTLNYLVNDFEGFKRQLASQIQRYVNTSKSKNKKSGTVLNVLVRFHDSGDFFSPDYTQLAEDMAIQFPTVIFMHILKNLELTQN
jgi:hypothetical protein